MANTINGMNANQLKQLLKDTIEKINLIDSSIGKINKNLENSINANNQISGNNGNNGILQNIKDAYDEIYGINGDEGKFKEIEDAYNEILIDNDNDLSLKTQINELILYIEEKKKEIDNFRKTIFGYNIKKEDGTLEKKDGLFDNINNFHTNQKEKFQTLYNKIDKELTAGTTSLELAKVFSDKVKEYKNAGFLWQFLFILIILLLLYNIDGKFDISNRKILLVKLLSHLPIFILSIWLLIFIGNRRAEAKKLEESYKHKEVMARSYVGYKKTIEELEGDLEENDKEIMKKHMNNLLNTINNDSSIFLNSKGENHPFLDIVKNIFKKGNFPSGIIETEFGKIELNKK